MRMPPQKTATVGLEGEHAGAVAERFRRRAHFVEHRHQQVGHVRVFRELPGADRPRSSRPRRRRCTIGSGLKLCWLPSLSELP